MLITCHVFFRPVFHVRRRIFKMSEVMLLSGFIRAQSTRKCATVSSSLKLVMGTQGADRDRLSVPAAGSIWAVEATGQPGLTSAGFFQPLQGQRVLEAQVVRAAEGLASKLLGSRPLFNAACWHLAAASVCDNLRLGVCRTLQGERRGPLLE